MPCIFFTENLQRHLACKPMQVTGKTAADCLAAVFHREPRLRSYLLDDQGSLRQHVNIYIDGVMIADRRTLSDATAEDSEIYVMQALSGG